MELWDTPRAFCWFLFHVIRLPFNAPLVLVVLIFTSSIQQNIIGLQFSFLLGPCVLSKRTQLQHTTSLDFDALCAAEMALEMGKNIRGGGESYS